MREPTSAEVRAVDVDQMREWYRDSAERTSLRQLAPTIPLGHSTLHNFLSGATPHPRVHRLLALKYLRDLGNAAPTDPGAVGESAIDSLLEPFDPEIQADGRRAILKTLAGLYVRSGRDAPAWITSATLGHA